MPRRFLIVAVTLAVILSVAAFASYRMWIGISDGLGMDGHGFAALIIGAVGSLVLGGGLMALVFFSSRHGYDERADSSAHPIEKP
jgi:hypothetical protein